MRTPSTDAGALAGCATFQTLRPQASLHPLQDETTAYWRCWDARKQSTRCQRSGWSLIGWLSAEHRFLMSHPSCLCGLRGYRGRAARETSARSESDSDQMWRAYSHADGAAPGDGHRFVCRFQHFAHLSAVFRYTLTASILPANTSRKHTHSAYFCRRALSNKDTKSRRP